jgi:hypothetical protein
MNGRVLHFGKTAHQAVESLLPWFVNGTLDDRERRRVEEHLQECPRCQRDVEWLRAFGSAYAASDVAPACGASWDQLRARIAPASPTWRRPLAALSASGLAALVRAWAPWAAAAQFILILGMGSLLLSNSGPISGDYRTLSAASETGPASASLAVKFDPRIAGGEVTRILQRAGVRIVDGPTATDAYVLAVSAERAAGVVRQLRAEPAVVFVERMEMPDPK